jgi:chromosome segregation ATPase
VVVREKTKQTEQLNATVAKCETKLTTMRNDMQHMADKVNEGKMDVADRLLLQLIAIESERDALANERSRLQQEVTSSRDQIQRKNDEFQSTLDNLTSAHRAADDARLNAIQEMETSKSELVDLQVGRLICSC